MTHIFRTLVYIGTMIPAIWAALDLAQDNGTGMYSRTGTGGRFACNTLMSSGQGDEVWFGLTVLFVPSILVRLFRWASPVAGWESFLHCCALAAAAWPILFLRDCGQFGATQSMRGDFMMPTVLFGIVVGTIAMVVPNPSPVAHATKQQH